jgi:hypothetical protein
MAEGGVHGVKDFDTTSVLFIYVCMYVLNWSSNARENSVSGN